MYNCKIKKYAFKRNYIIIILFYSKTVLISSFSNVKPSIFYLGEKLQCQFIRTFLHELEKIVVACCVSDLIFSLSYCDLGFISINRAASTAD